MLAILIASAAGGREHFPRVLAEWTALARKEQHEEFLVELLGVDVERGTFSLLHVWLTCAEAKACQTVHT